MYFSPIHPSHPDAAARIPTDRGGFRCCRTGKRATAADRDRRGPEDRGDACHHAAPAPYIYNAATSLSMIASTVVSLGHTRRARRTVRFNIGLALGLKLVLAVGAVAGVVGLAVAVLVGTREDSSWWPSMP